MKVIGLFLSQCFFFRLPQDWQLTEDDFKWAAVFYFAVFWCIQILMIGEPAEALIAAASEVILTQIFVFAVLAVMGREEYFMPTSTLLMGSVGIIGTVAVPLIIWLRLAEDQALLASFYTLMACGLWGLAVLAHLFRQALSRTPTFGFGLACAYAVETYLGTLILLVL